MISLKSLFTSPTFADEEQTRVAGLTHVLSLLLLGVGGIGLIISPLAAPRSWPPLATSGVLVILTLATQLTLRRRRVRTASLLLVMAGGLITTLSVAALGGVSHPFMGIYLVVILLAALLIGGWAAIAAGVLAILTTLALALAEVQGWLAPRPVAPLAEWLTQALIAAFVAITLYLAARNLSQAMRRADLHQESLAHSYRELDSIRANLEQRVAERTLSLERRSRYLEASAEVARAAASILDSDQLIRMVVELMRDRFDLYYVGLFLVDEANEWAVLRAGTGEAGRAMLTRGHRIRIGSGMIGWSIANAQPRIAGEAGEDAVRLVTPEVPETRSEAALPLRSRGRVLGALTVQSAQPEAFDQDTITVLQTMVDQIALALDNARLLAESQAAVETTRRAYGEISRRAWHTLFAARREWGYRYAGESVTPLPGDWRSEMVWAIQSGQSVQTFDDEAAALTIPLSVRDQVIGALSLRRKQSGLSWQSDEIAVFEMLAAEISQALESARLYRETQRRAAREQLIGEVGGRIRETLDLETILQTAASELRQALALGDVTIRLGESSPQEEAGE